MTTAPTTEKYFDPKKFMWASATFAPLVPVFAIWLYWQTSNELALWFGFGFFYALVPICENLFGQDTHNPPREAIGPLRDDKFYSWIVFAAVPLIYFSWAFNAWFVANTELSTIGYIAVTLGTGMMLGGSLNAGHETGHRRDPVSLFFARLFLSISFMGHFRIEHNLGHHVQVGTKEDSATSKMGQNFYAFTMRELPGGYARAWDIESKRLKRSGKSVFNLQNELLQNWSLTFIMYGAIIYAFGWYLLPFLLGAALFANLMLSSANYIEHYGLIRQKRDDGKYERVQPHHSWNANHILSNILLFHLQRHSDHHAHAERPYQCLRHFDSSPQLPFGYFTMYLLAWVPPLWFRVVDPLLAKQVGHDMEKAYIKDSYRDKAFAKYHHPDVDAGAVAAE